MTGRILVVDDDAAIRTVMRESLRRAGHVVELAETLAAARAGIATFAPDVLVTDVMLPDGNGLDQLPAMIALRPGMPVIVLSAQNTLATAVRATEQGAFDYLPKPFDLGELGRSVEAALALIGRAAEVPDDGVASDGLPLIGRSPAMQDVYRTIARVVANDLTVLVLGESGTGKELVAQAIHDLGPRAARPFVAINMAAIPRDLIESELFGHERGAFTGAAQRNVGRFEQAQGGTLFLDEIGDMPIDAQTRLLRVLQSGAFTPIGSTRQINADVRVIAATHKDLGALIAEGRFREDLFYRLNVVPVRLPSLRQRGSDIVDLARHFLDRAAADGLPRKRLADAACERLMQHDWPGNVRELENVMRRAAVLARGDVITTDLLDHELGGAAASLEAVAGGGEGDLATVIDEWMAGWFLRHRGVMPPGGLYDSLLPAFEGPLLRHVLLVARGNQLQAARMLGINRNTLRKKLVSLGIEAADLRRPEV
ncbi:MAG TPA: nitrogen regulation protein NR(I) [Sphingomonas sp.]|jgi:two-component system nitrogen regulation response regulator GlnG|uniref:nitrogen regulation protein NR(I) n=1 Tax=Sphingomonas sp. TaxID=28214 RepID=UPI002EDACD5D